MTKSRQTQHAEELEDLAQCHRIGDVWVTVQCFLIAEPVPHYEIVLRCGEQIAVVDVPFEEQSCLSLRVEQAIRAFMGSIFMRL